MSKTNKTDSVSDTEFFAEKSQRGDVTISVDGVDVPLTNLNKVYWPNEGYTKFDLLKYYYLISKTILPYLKDRPLILKRYPNGITGQMFYQHNLENAPEFVEIFETRESTGKLVHNPVANNLAALLYIVNLGTITQNPWFSRVQSISMPDYFAFDLDPGDNATFEQVKVVAREVKAVLEEFGLTGYPKTSGSSGIHIYVPIKPQYTYKQIVPFAKKLATIVAERNPKDATVRRMTADRKSTEVYVDYLQNIEGKSLAAAYAVREKPGAPVSAPITWSEITKKLSIEQFTMQNMPARLKKKGDLYSEVLTKRQSLTAAMKKAK
ncbi:MAG: non-homologous end-joining DNA ligase [Bacteroidota bacterium]|nr:non-homologous end-joining DNA ligase [Bacteroidota bacterium]MDP4233148.1 non-homologous end-joining DNA ligase [Bacteroidota bacterium]MDP4241707.1 non-homologous end-joining DNA ligase [Bacteroidota bacterium]MDP4287365.1 non-homologous end-joining DNA ligase [Bacteroidota bacterium]